MVVITLPRRLQRLQLAAGRSRVDLDVEPPHAVGRREVLVELPTRRCGYLRTTAARRRWWRQRPRVPGRVPARAPVPARTAARRRRWRWRRRHRRRRDGRGTSGGGGSGWTATRKVPTSCGLLCDVVAGGRTSLDRNTSPGICPQSSARKSPALGAQRYCRGLVTLRPGPVLRAVTGAAGLGRVVLAVPIGYLAVLTASAWAATLAGRTATAPGRAAPHVRRARAGPRRGAGDRRRARRPDRASTTRPSAGRVHVVADHCTDRTAEHRRAAGADGARAARRGPRARARRWRWPSTSSAAPDADPSRRVRHRRRRHRRRPRRSCAARRRLRRRCARRPGAVPRPRPRRVGGRRPARRRARRCATTSGRSGARRSAARAGSTATAWRSAPTSLVGRDWSDHLTEDLELQMELLLDGVARRLRAGRRRRGRDAGDARGRDDAERAVGAGPHRAGPALRAAARRGRAAGAAAGGSPSPTRRSTTSCRRCRCSSPRSTAVAGVRGRGSGGRPHRAVAPGAGARRRRSSSTSCRVSCSAGRRGRCTGRCCPRPGDGGVEGPAVAAHGPAGRRRSSWRRTGRGEAAA